MITDKSRITTILLLIIIAVFLMGMTDNTDQITSEHNQKIEQTDEYKIIGYVAGWREWDAEMINAEQLTHINYAFADIEDGRVVSIYDNDAENFQLLNSLKTENPDLKILISVGGWTRSTFFSDAALTEESRKIFAESAIEYMKEFDIDGIDLDWEYPGLPGDGNVYRAADKQNFTLMLKELREQLDEQTRIDERQDNPYLLTIATGASKSFLQNTEMHKAHQYLDFINVMTYDYHTGGSPIAGHHANLYPSASEHFTGSSAEQSIQWHIDAGIPANKLVLGVAFYGRYWTDVRTQENGLYQWTPGGERGYYTFDELNEEFINQNDFTRYWDEEARAPYLWNPDKQKFITYDDEQSLRYKTDYIRARGLGGAMFWEYSNNLRGELLNTLHNGLN